MALVPNSFTVDVQTLATSTANRALAPVTTNNRFFRGFYVTNTTNAAIDLSVGIGVAATLSASNADVANVVSIPAKANAYPIAQYVGQGRKALGTSGANEVMAFASGAGLKLTGIYADDL